MAPKLRRSQPADLSAEQIAQVLKEHAPVEARKKAALSGILFAFSPAKKGGTLDRANIEKWRQVIKALLELCPSGIANASLIQTALEDFNESIGGALTSEDHEVIKTETFKGEHLYKQSHILKRYLQGVARIKSNSSTSTRHPQWLRGLLDLLPGAGDQPTESPSESPQPIRDQLAASRERNKGNFFNARLHSSFTNKY